ncbi:MAG: FHA domain-containing protein [Anaerolineae bacterium]|nr:FHA domain-containing protein [Anaerolineae bacterium]
MALKLIMQHGPTPGREFTIQNHPQVIGRGQDSQIVIIDKTLSRQHARVWTTADGLVVEDAGSTNGTFVNSQRISKPTLLLPGDILQLGESITFTVKADADFDKTMLAGPVPTSFEQTMIPGSPPAPVVGPTAPAAQSGLSPWIWVGVAVIIAVLIVGGTLGYLYYARVLQATTPPTEVAVLPTPSPTLRPTDTPVPAHSLTPTPSPTIPSIQVPGVPAMAAREQPLPADVINKVDPFCNQQVAVMADEPVLITWQRRLAAAEDQIDYLAEWLDAVYYDLTLDGRPVGAFSYQQNPGPVLDWWANVGLLSPGKHYLRIEWYTNRPVSNGLDVEPADGVMDVFGPGLAGEGSCEIVVPEGVAAATSTPAPTFTPTPLPTPTPQPVAPAQPSTSAAPLGIFQDFESPGTWQRGDQPYGDFTRSSAQVHSGSYAGQLSYNFPSPDNDYVVFTQSRALAGQPNAISAWVYGDGSGHFLNVWIRDANGQTWAMSFGQVKHNGWQEMTAYIDPSQPWPSGHISGPDNGVIDYPISFQALVLDDGSDNYSGQGTIYIDDLNSQEGAMVTAPTSPPGGGVPAPGGQQAPANSGIYTLRIGNQHRYEEPWGAPRSGDPCEAYRNNNWDDEHANYRGFNVEVLLTNNSAAKVQDDWGEEMRFFTASGGEVAACYYGYGGAGPAPGSTTSLTFFSVVAQGDYVQVMQLNLNGQFLKLCLDGRGGWSACN